MLVLGVILIINVLRVEIKLIKNKRKDVYKRQAAFLVNSGVEAGKVVVYPAFSPFRHAGVAEHARRR